MTMQKSYTFFTIVVPDGEDAREWAHDNWDRFGFDYDLSKVGDKTICAWSLENDEQLERELEADDISFTTFKVTDLDRFLGL